jgi:hypothetical protein
VHEALMRPGDAWRAPQGVEGLELRAGNAGGVMLEVDGVRYGPLGGAGTVVSGVSLMADDIRNALTRADGGIPGTATFAQR